MQSELPWSVEYVRARLGVQVTKYEVVMHLKRCAQDHWLAKRQLEASAEQLAQILSNQDVMKVIAVRGATVVMAQSDVRLWRCCVLCSCMRTSSTRSTASHWDLCTLRRAPRPNQV